MNNPLIKALLPSSLLKARQLINITLVVMAMLLSPVNVVAAQLVDINNADAETMIENWKGIGETKARAIVAYRKKNGPFSDINDLANVKGIGEGLIKNNRKYMSLSKGLSKPSGKNNSKSTTKKSSSTSSGKSSKDKKASSSSGTKQKSTRKESAKKSSSSKKSTSKKSTGKKKSKSKKCKKGSTDKDCKATKKSSKKKSTT